MTMPGGDTGVSGLNSFFGETLVDFVNNGTVPLSRVQDMAVSLMHVMYNILILPVSNVYSQAGIFFTRTKTIQQ